MEFRGLKAQYSKYKIEIDSAIQKVLSRGDFIEGEEVKILEDRLAKYTGVKNCVTCANGTDALSLVLMAWGIGKDDAVFVPDFTFFATAEVVSYAGATPIFIDVDYDTFNIDTNKLEDAIRKVIKEGKLNPKVIIPVDLFGLPANYIKIERIAKKYNLLVLEDAAQGFGGNINGKKACSFGDAATTSFFPAKPLGCYGDGGAIFTNDDELAKLLRSLKVHGRGADKYDNIRIGVNSRLDTIQAAILNVKLDAFINHELEDVNRIAKLYDEKLKDIVEIPVIPEGYYSSYAQYTIKFESKEIRNCIQNKLNELQIPTFIYYTKPLHQQTIYKNLNVKSNCFNEGLDIMCERILSIPIHPYLSEYDVYNICLVF